MGYKIEPRGNRYIITSLDGATIDDANGRGYKTLRSASRAAHFKYATNGYENIVLEKQKFLNDPSCNLLPEEKQPYLDNIEKDLRLIHSMR